MIPLQNYQSQRVSSTRLRKQYQRSRIIHYDLLTQTMYSARPQDIDIQPLTKQHQITQDFMDQWVKDSKKYSTIKHKLFQKYFSKFLNQQLLIQNSQIGNKHEQKLHQKNANFRLTPTLRNYSKKRQGYEIFPKLIKSQEFSPSLNLFRSSSRRKKLSQYNKAIDNLLEQSTKLQIDPKRQQKRKRIQSHSQKLKKQISMMRTQKNQILTYLKHNHNDKTPVKPTNKQMFNIQYTRYLKQKSFTRIEKQFIQRRAGSKQKLVERFQQFILREVKFSQKNRDQLQDFFSFIREQFRRIQKN